MERHKEESTKGKVRWLGQGSQARLKVLRKSVRKNPGVPGMVGTKAKKGKSLQVYLSPTPGKKPVTKATGPIFLAHISPPLNEP